jgi:hypothetical protein
MPHLLRLPYGNPILGVQPFLALRFLAVRMACLTMRLSWDIWNSKPIKQLKKKLVMEFFTLVLGPSGNAIVLLIFWPGWLVLAIAFYSIWFFVG